MHYKTLKEKSSPWTVPQALSGIELPGGTAWGMTEHHTEQTPKKVFFLMCPMKILLV
jgi:hypothetical protein